MATSDSKNSWPKLISFECFGTFVPWPEALRSIFEALRPDSFADSALANESEGPKTQFLSDHYRPYSEILPLGLALTMEKWGLANIDEARELLMDELRESVAYPDVAPALRVLGRNYRLAVISNVNRDLVAESLEKLPAEIEILSADQLKAYKPDPEFFRAAYRELGVDLADVVHVASGFARDMVPASELEIARIWVNRNGEMADPAALPTVEIPDLAGLADAVSRIGATRKS